VTIREHHVRELLYTLSRDVRSRVRIVEVPSFMQAHERQMCEEGCPVLDPRTRPGSRHLSRCYFNLLAIPYPKDDTCYAVILHELGHMRERTGDERIAWCWARRNARYWNDEMEATMRAGLRSYERIYGLPALSRFIDTEAQHCREKTGQETYGRSNREAA
jgi:hypothetical protein